MELIMVKYRGDLQQKSMVVQVKEKVFQGNSQHKLITVHCKISIVQGGDFDTEQIFAAVQLLDNQE